MLDEYKRCKDVTQRLDQEFSPSFCLAKWYHTNIYFQTGETHSCYHPAPHPIDIEAIKRNPAAIHNTATKIEERRQMLSGERPKGCQYCWNIEDINPDLVSDRQIRTASLLREERLKEIKTQPVGFDVIPDYIEISFSNLCNFKCGYCHPKASSKFHSEIVQYGPYQKSFNHRCDVDWFKIYDEDQNPYLDAWWRWWPQIANQLKILRLTGGEPLLQKSTYRLLELLEKTPSPRLELNVNSNMGMANEKVFEFCDRIQRLVDEKKIKTFKLFTSIDCWGPQAEYVRTGLNLSTFEKNLETYLNLTGLPLTFMITFNIFALFSFKELLEKILEFRSYYQSNEKDTLQFHRIRFDISYLKEPLQFDINILPKQEFLPYLERGLEFVRENLDDRRKDRFSFMEYQRILRIVEYMKNTHYEPNRILQGRKDFFNFFSEYDRRRKLNINLTFPELSHFWQMCEKSTQSAAEWTI